MDYKLVPVMPTREMIDAASSWPLTAFGIAEVYRAMLDAAPDNDELATLRAENQRLVKRVAELAEALDGIFVAHEGGDAGAIDGAIFDAKALAKEGDESEGERMKRAYGLPGKEGE